MQATRDATGEVVTSSSPLSSALLLSTTMTNTANAAERTVLLVPADRLIAFDNSGGHSSVQLPSDEKMAWILAFALLLVVATVGNSIVTWFIIAHRRLSKAYNCFMLSLTLADFAMLYFECVFNFIYILEGHWRYGTAYCIVDNFLSELTTAASIFTLTVTSYDRYMAIVKPFLPRPNRKSAILTVATCWLIATLLAAPTLIYSAEYIRTTPTGEDKIKCEVVWPDSDLILNNYSYRILVFAITYVLPSLLMAYWNFRIAVVLSKSIVQFEGARHQQIDVLAKKRKHLACGMWTILVIFCLCWLPYQTYLMYKTFTQESNIVTKRVCMGVYWLAVANAAVNPFLFYRLDKQYQEYIRNFFTNIYNCIRTCCYSRKR